jgi:signal peptidase I
MPEPLTEAWPAPPLHHSEVRAPRTPVYHGHPVGTLPAAQSLLYVLVVALFLITFTVQPIRIPSSSMEPTLLVGDFLLLDKQSIDADESSLFPPAGIGRGDIVVFHDPVDDPSVHLVKRVIGLPGDRIHLRNGIVYRNGRPLREPYAVHRAAPSDIFRDNFPLLTSMDNNVNPDWWIHLRTLIQGGEIIVPPYSYFVMGDNRNDSEDSRYWGFVPRADIIGQPFLIYFSWRQPTIDPYGSGGYSDRDPQTQPSDPPSALARIARWERTFQVVH